jgi:processive 1,2-diacylglycerol beta-glucosyltransferase
VINVFDNDTGKPLGTITEAQLQFLIDQLEEESPSDTDYYINRDTIDMLADDGADAALVELLRSALGDREDMEIRWERA